MDCRKAQGKINAFIDDTMEEKDMAEFLEHVKHCPVCYDELEVSYTVFSVVRFLDEEDEDNDLIKALDHKIEEKELWLKQQYRSRIIRRGATLFSGIACIFLIFSIFMFAAGNIRPKRQLYATVEHSVRPFLNIYGEWRAVDSFLYIKEGHKLYLLPPEKFSGMNIFNSYRINESVESGGNDE